MYPNRDGSMIFSLINALSSDAQQASFLFFIKFCLRLPSFYQLFSLFTFLSGRVGLVKKIK